MSTTHLIISNPWVENNNVSIDKELILKEQAKFSDKLVQVAAKELREDENTRKQCLEQLRNWISKNQDIQNCLTDDKFLLRFLRVKKFSLPMAQQTLLKYLNFRKRFNKIMYNMDYLEDNVNTIINNGFIFASPFRDSNSRRVIIYNLSKFDPHKYNSTDMARAYIITYETLLDDESNQILGVNHVGDSFGMTPAHVTLWSITELATLIRWGEQSFPMRHKEINIINFPAAFKHVYNFFKDTLKSEKLKNRLVIHNSLADLHNKVSKNCLPLEMGGVMPMADMVHLWKEELAAKRGTILKYDCMNLLCDSGIIRKKTLPAQDDTGIGSLPGSFRKLEVD